MNLTLDSPFLSAETGVGSNLPRAAASSSFKMELNVASISGASVFVTLNRSGILIIRASIYVFSVCFMLFG